MAAGGLTEASAFADVAGPPALLAPPSASPAEGTGLATRFTLAAGNWTHEDLPLAYAFAYRVVGSPGRWLWLDEPSVPPSPPTPPPMREIDGNHLR